MIKPLSRIQKVIAYGSLGMVLLCTLLGVFTIYVLATHEPSENGRKQTEAAAS